MSNEMVKVNADQSNAIGDLIESGVVISDLENYFEGDQKMVSGFIAESKEWFDIDQNGFVTYSDY